MSLIERIQMTHNFVRMLRERVAMTQSIITDIELEMAQFEIDFKRAQADMNKTHMEKPYEN
jgi:hypothetical protein